MPSILGRRTGGHEFLELVRCDAREYKPLARQGTWPIVVLPVHVQEECTAFIHATSSDDIPTQLLARVAGIRLPQIFSKRLDLSKIRAHRIPFSVCLWRLPLAPGTDNHTPLTFLFLFAGIFSPSPVQNRLDVCKDLPCPLKDRVLSHPMTTPTRHQFGVGFQRSHIHRETIRQVGLDEPIA